MIHPYPLSLWDEIVDRPLELWEPDPWLSSIVGTLSQLTLGTAKLKNGSEC